MRNLSFTGTLYGERLTLNQVSKAAARKLYEAGQAVYIQSSNFHPFGVWSRAHEIVKDDQLQTTFEAICNNFIYYNCNNEQGKYITFYKAN